MNPSPISRTLLALLGAAAALLAPWSAAAEVEVQRLEGAVRVSAQTTLNADLQTTWETLVGYERLPEFVPDMRTSRVLHREGDRVLVEQRGRAGFGPVQREFSLTLEVHEVPLQAVTARAIAGDFLRFDSGYRLRAGALGQTHLEYDALIAPQDGIPPLLGVPLMRRAIQRQFDALLAEIERRSAARPVLSPAALWRPLECGVEHRPATRFDGACHAV
jgi:hypothetical protein